MTSKFEQWKELDAQANAAYPYKKFRTKGGSDLFAKAGKRNVEFSASAQELYWPNELIPELIQWLREIYEEA